MFFEDLSDGPAPWQRLSPSLTHISLKISSAFKGVEATKIVLSILPNKREHILPNKREHTQAGAGLTSENPLLFNSCSAF